MARTKGPLFSLGASGQLGATLVYSNWKGRDYCREYAIPQNPQSTTQVNVRTAWDLLVQKWQSLSAGDKTTWDTFAEQFSMSGFNQLMSRGMDAYVDQLGTSTTPASVGLSGNPPAETFTWA
jgi:hypothetical protein